MVMCQHNAICDQTIHNSLPQMIIINTDIPILMHLFTVSSFKLMAQQGDNLGEKVSLIDSLLSVLRWKKFKCVELIGKSKIRIKTSS